MQTKVVICLLAIGALAFTSVGCAGKAKSRVKKGEIAKTIDMTPDKKKYIEVIGIGAADQSLTNSTQRMGTARTAAVVDAQYRLLSMVKGLQLVGGITVEKAIETDSKLQTIIDAELKGAEEVKLEWTNDDGCLVTMRQWPINI